MKKEIRAFDFEVRAEDGDRGKTLTGMPIVYDERTNLGWYDEIIDNGALAETDLRDVRFLVNHNTDMIPLARSRNNNANSTMQLEVIEGKGMTIRVDLDTENNAEAKSLYSAVERGDISGMSFMFLVDGDSWRTSTRITRQGMCGLSVRCLRCPRSHSRRMKRHRFRPAACLTHWRVRRHRWRARERSGRKSRGASRRSESLWRYDTWN